MHTSQANPFVIPTSITTQVDQIMTAARARFGHDAFRMEGEGGDGGGSGDGQAPGQSGEQNGTGAGGAGGNAAGQGGEQAGQGQGQSADQKASDQAAAQKVEDLPDWAQKIIRDTRDEAAKNRTGKTAAEEQQQKILKAVAQAAGLKIEGDDEQPDPAKLTEELTKTQQQAREAAVQLAVYRTAGKNQGDPDALLDSRAFLTKVADLDPTAADFATKVETAIKDAVKDNPKLKATQAAGSSSADHGAGGSGEQQKRTPKSLTDAVGGHYGT